MEKNTLENTENQHLLPDMDPIDRGLDFEILEEIPEIDSVKSSDSFQIFFLPLLALIIITAIPLILSFSIATRTKTGINRDFPYTSLENPLLQTAVQELNDKRRDVNLKDVQIRHYQNRVLAMDEKIQLLQGLMEETLLEKKNNLLGEINTALGEERALLESLGSSEEQINRELDRLKSDMESRYDETMAKFRTLEMSAYMQRLSDLNHEKAFLDNSLNLAIEERQTMAETLETDESELLAQLYEEDDFLNTINAGIDTDLAILKETRNAENYWLDELANQYIGLIESITSRDYEGAQANLDALNTLFTNPETAELPGIKIRNEADKTIVGFFSAYLSSLEQNELSALFADSRMLVDQALSHMEAGRYQEADIAWQRLDANWDLMDQATRGYLATQYELTTIELRRFYRLSESYLLSNDYQEASSSWISGLEQIPDPLGHELRAFWQLWNSRYDARLLEKDQTAMSALAREKEDSAIRYESLKHVEEAKLMEITTLAKVEQQQLHIRLDNVLADNEALKLKIEHIEKELELTHTGLIESKETIPEGMVSEDKLETAEQIIADLENKISSLEARYNESNATVITEEISMRWQLFGVIVQIVNESLIIEPLNDYIPSVGSDIRVMRSLGKNRVIHLADGKILEANATRAISRLSSSSNGADIYGSPEIDDLIYISRASNTEQ